MLFQFDRKRANIVDKKKGWFVDPSSCHRWPDQASPGSMEEGDADAANAHEVKFEPGKGKGIQVPPAKKGFINLAAFGIQVGALEGFFIRGIWACDG